MPSTLSLVQSKVSSSFYDPFDLLPGCLRLALRRQGFAFRRLGLLLFSRFIPLNGNGRSRVVSGPFPRNRSASGLEAAKLTAATTPKMTALKNSRKTRTAVCRLLSGGFTIFSLMNGFSLDLFSSGASAISHKTPLLSIIVFAGFMQQKISLGYSIALCYTLVNGQSLCPLF